MGGYDSLGGTGGGKKGGKKAKKEAKKVISLHDFNATAGGGAKPMFGARMDVLPSGPRAREEGEEEMDGYGGRPGAFQRGEGQGQGRFGGERGDNAFSGQRGGDRRDGDRTSSLPLLFPTACGCTRRARGRASVLLR